MWGRGARAQTFSARHECADHIKGALTKGHEVAFGGERDRVDAEDGVVGQIEVSGANHDHESGHHRLDVQLDVGVQFRAERRHGAHQPLLQPHIVVAAPHGGQQVRQDDLHTGTATRVTQPKAKQREEEKRETRGDV